MIGRIDVVRFNGFKATCRGFSHIQSDTECQDAAGYYCDEGIAVCVVSDGHGSEKYFRSGVGSEKAVEIAVEAIKAFADRQKQFLAEDKKTRNPDNIITIHNYERLLSNLSGYIVSQWINLIGEHWESNPCDDNEKPVYDKHFSEDDEVNITKIYGATLIIGVVTDTFNAVIQIGDGAACIIKRNGVKLLADTIDENQYAGRTNSLSSSNCLTSFRFHYSNLIPKAIVVASDGVVDSYAGNNGKDFLTFCGKLVDLYLDNYEEAQGFLEEWLPQLSEQGSQDDVSVAGLFLLPAMQEDSDADSSETDSLEDIEDEVDNQANFDDA
jgi:hypothetical protein